MATGEERRRRMAAERDKGHGWGTIRPVRWEAVERHRRGTVLDVGCSGGAYVAALRERGVAAVGVDLLPHDEWGALPGAFAGADATALPFADRAFGTLLAFETLEHLPEPDRTLREWHRVARHRLVLTVPDSRSPSWAQAAGLDFHHHVDPTHVNRFDEDALVALVREAGFRVLECRGILPVNPFVPALDALGLPPRLVEGGGRRLQRLVRRTVHSGLLLAAERT